MSDFEFIKFSREGGRADLKFSNPPYNLLTGEMLEEIVRALDTLRDDETLKVLLIQGEGDTFCGGVRTEDITADSIGTLMPHYSRVYNHLNDIRGVVVSAVLGEASGFGCELAAFCDVCIAGNNAMF
ncbi:MAG: enoyl-CoA hydratase/isomerase family protein, partial [Calditrichaeota bacterium]|nr:enoyl-CoA hydratase/isomerase family protein [Calditrichota bacterium]